MLTLLRRPEHAPPPRDWLLARLRGRRASRATRPAEAVPWSALLVEMRWLYPQLDAEWRRSLAPLCALLEVRPLAMALRLRSRDKERVAAAALLADSWLAPPLLQLALGELSPAERLRALCARPEVAQLLGSATAPAAAGVRQCEALLHDALLDQGRRHGGHPALSLLWSGLIDLRNLLALNKARRWQPEHPPRLLSGGALHPEPLSLRWPLPAEPQWRWHGRALGSGPAVTERLLDELGRALRRAAGDPLDLGLLLDHLAQQARSAGDRGAS